MNYIDVAVSIVDSPDLSEHRRKELALVRLLALAIEVFLNTGEKDLPVRVDAARDLIRELKHVYPQTAET
jgi:hypothetical protein